MRVVKTGDSSGTALLLQSLHGTTNAALPHTESHQALSLLSCVTCIKVHPE